jgi:ATP-dependent RNA helicase RhlB
MNFSEFKLSENLQKSIDNAGYSKCTEIQEEALRITLQGKDVFAQSQTGTGKTGAFLISILELMEVSEYRERAIILVPTRELATQVEKEARLLSTFLDYSIVSIYGGVGYAKQEQALRDDVDIIVGTPGRVIDLMNKGLLNLKKHTFAVIDEADRMFDMGFVNDIKKILRSTAKKEIRQTMLFSATLDFSVKRLAEEFMLNPEEITISPEEMTVDAIDQKLYHISSYDKMKMIMGILNRETNPRVIIFANTKHICEEVANRLTFNGFKASYLTGDLPQSKREKRIAQFKRNSLDILVATDVAARGIHVDNLSMVINYDLPQHAENYVHRIGRTARAGETGTAITFACETFVEYLEPIETLIGAKIPSIVAANEDFAEDRSEGKNWKRKKPSPKKRTSSSKSFPKKKIRRNNWNSKTGKIDKA